MAKKILSFVLVTGFLVPAGIALAVNPFLGNPFPGAFNIDPIIIISNILAMIWAITAAAVIVLFIIAGFKFLTAHGDPAKISTARQSVLWGVAGIAVIVISFSAITLVRMLLNL